MRPSIEFGIKFAIVTILWTVVLGDGTAISLAEVPTVRKTYHWLHVKFDNGEERWSSLTDGKHFSKTADGDVVFVDYKNNVRLTYHANGNASILKTAAIRYPPGERHETIPQWVAKTPLEAAGILEVNVVNRSVSDKQKEKKVYSERHTDPINGRQLQRHDQYAKDALGDRLLIRQVWVDPKMHLPIRIRRRVQPGWRKEPKQKFTAGEYDFPAQGPANIYELGVPRDAPIIRRTAEPGQPNANISRLLEAARKAKDLFPGRFRVVIWKADMSVPGIPKDKLFNSSEIDVIYWDGKPTRRPGLTPDFTGVKIRRERYFSLDPSIDSKNTPHHLPMPTTVEKVMAWTDKQVPVSLSVAGPKLTIFKNGPYPPTVKVERSPQVRVRHAGGGFYLARSDLPNQYQWPTVERNETFVQISNRIKTIPDAIGLRWEAGNSRQDYYLDPKHDHICVKQIRWEKRSDKWEKSREYELTDLVRLPGGQWYATKRYLRDYPSPKMDTMGQIVTFRVDVRTIKEEDFPNDTFSATQLLESARHAGATIETY